MPSTVRIGIDVGGTFTHAVAVDNETLQVLSHAVTPTTHRAAEGVARGIVTAFEELRNQFSPETRIVLLAHSTTQATNALLEGDVARVGIVGLGSGLSAAKARLDMTLGPIELAPGRFLESEVDVVNPQENGEAIHATLKRMASEGVGAVVAAEAFSVDDPSGELLVAEIASSLNLPACGTHEMSGLYGLRVRTRTAVLNASILPKMIDTALMTDRSLKSLSVEAPLMVMRSDGGIMALDEMRKRPVLTLLSGPAAGIAAALMFLRTSDAVFLEVGGTSTDICLIKNGRAAVKSAVLGGNPTYLRTLDSRTLGIAGGSMLRRTASGIDMGPRSAHLAGAGYASFTDLCPPLRVIEESPLPGDPPYILVEDANGARVALTTTDAGNLAGLVPPGNYAQADVNRIRPVFEAVAAFLGTSADALTARMLESAVAKVRPTVESLFSEYGMADHAVKLIGGGGGAAAIVPALARAMQLPFEIAPRAEVISAIGAALAMVKETIEKNILDPTQEELASLKAEAEKRVLAMGADPASIEVGVEVDSQKKIVRATATGSVQFSAHDVLSQDVGESGRLSALLELGDTAATWKALGHTGFLHIYESITEHRQLFGLLRRQKRTIWVTDPRGAVKLQAPQASISVAGGAEAMATLSKVIADATTYGDAGAQVPLVRVVAGHRIVDLSALQTAEQMMALARSDLSGLSAGEKVFFVVGASS